jgi:hypothetical protein
MVMMKRPFDLSWKMLVVPHGLALLMGIAYAAVPPALFGAGFRAFVGVAWSDFASAEPVLSSFVNMHARETGAMATAASLLALLVTLFPYRKRERWSWWSLLAADAIGLGFMAGATAAHGDWSVFAVLLALLAVALLGLALGAREILTKIDETRS